MRYITLNKTINSPSDQFPIVVNEYPQLNTDEWNITNVTSLNGRVIINDIDGSTFTLKPMNLKNSYEIINVMMHNDTAVTKRNRDYTLSFDLNITCNYYVPFKLTNLSPISEVIHISCSDVYYYVGNENDHPSRSSFTRTDYSSGSTIVVSVPAGKTVFLFSERQKMNYDIVFDFWGTEEWRFGGNIMGMLLNNKFEVDDALSGFLSYNKNSVTTSPELPETNLRTGCYKGLFKSSTKIKTPPSILPATNVPENAYNSMFYDCNSLETAPVISARNVGNYGMAEMFYNCTSLTSIPDMTNIKPLSRSTKNVFKGMFQGCTSLIRVENLPNLDLNTIQNHITGVVPNTDGWFMEMFKNCSNLNEVHNRMTAVSLNDNCKNIFYNWLDGVSPTGTYYYNRNLLSMSYYTGTQAEKEEQIRADYNVPSGWTMVPETF